MAINREIFVQNYLAEANDNVTLVEKGVVILKKDPGNVDELNAVLRALHSLKGSSRMLKFPTVEKIAHGMESALKGVRDQRYVVDAPFVKLIFAGTDFLHHCMDLIKEEGNDTYECDGLLQLFERASAHEPYSLEGLALPEKDSQHGQSDVVESDAQDNVPSKRSAKSEIISPETVRVKVEQIENLIETVQRLIVSQFQLKRDSDTVCALAEQLRCLETDAAFGLACDTMQKKLSDYSKQSKDHFSLIERSSFELIEQAYTLRMLPMELVLGSMPKMVEETALSVDKQVDLTIKGSSVSLDRMVLENLKDPLIHLVRNAIDHGIESPQHRKEQGKAEAGQLLIECRNEGQNIILAIRDDGKGIDFEKIRARAIEMNPYHEDEIKQADHNGLLTYLFSPGFSTKKEATQLSGRGVGLDIVQENLEKIKGKISVETELGVGTCFTMTLPLSLATVSGFFVFISGQRCFMPANYIEEILMLSSTKLLALHNREAIKFRDKVIPLYRMSWMIRGDHVEEKVAVVVSLLGEIVALAVDSIEEYSSRILKPLPASLSDMAVLQGVVFDDSFNMVTILQIPEIVRRIKGLRDIDMHKRVSATQKRYKRVLVVDDSLSTRDVEKSILELENYHVETACDGIEALRMIKQDRFALIVTDIDMPRMDGFTFVENLRREKLYQDVPVVVVSSMENPALVQRAKDCGANEVIVKADFDRNNLLAAVKKLIGNAEVSDAS